MILVFGGTTEGRVAVDVLERAGKPYFYSTRTAGQDVPLCCGRRLSGAMDAGAIAGFCRENGIRCIVDAAHPFASGLHGALAGQSLPVIRLERPCGPAINGATYCDGFGDAAERLLASPARRLLALTGVNTIGPLKAYWTRHDTVFRILDRPESRKAARACGFPMENAIFHARDLAPPSLEEEMRVIKATGCDAMVTKESGESGGFGQKVQAAMALGLRVFVVRRPPLPSGWTYVEGRHGLRRAVERLVPGFFPLRTGFTTGLCATAATRAALLSLLGHGVGGEVEVALPCGEAVRVAVHVERPGKAWVVKDPGDDPDATGGCRISSTVALREGDPDRHVRFLRGEGVGLVTLPGLGIEVGGPAINPVPRMSMEAEARRLTPHGVDITIGVENGRKIALRTLNPRLGVVDGISIIGTTGIVSPLSDEAFIGSLRQELRVARALGCKAVALVSGRKGEAAMRHLGLRCVHYGNLVGKALEMAHVMGFERVVLGILIGKAVKLADGRMDTHSRACSINRPMLRRIAEECGATGRPRGGWEGDFQARELWDCMPGAFFDRIRELCLLHCRKAFPTGDLEIMLVCDERA